MESISSPSVLTTATGTSPIPLLATWHWVSWFLSRGATLSYSTPFVSCPIICISSPKATLLNPICFVLSPHSNNAPLSLTKIARMVRSGRQNSTTTFCAHGIDWNWLPPTSGRTRFVRVSARMQLHILCPAHKRSIGKDSARIHLFGSRLGRKSCRALTAKNAGSPHKPGQSPALHEIATYESRMPSRDMRRPLSREPALNEVEGESCPLCRFL